MLNFVKALSLLTSCVVLASCGGGGGGGGAAEEPGQIRLTISVSSNSVPANTGAFPPDPDSDFIVEVDVRVTNANGGAIEDGTIVTLRVSPATRGQVSIPDDPTTGVDEFSVLSQNVSNSTVGGFATFFLHSLTQTGTVTLTASATDPNSGQSRSASRTVNVVDGPDPIDQLSFIASRSTLPANVSGVPVFLGSPYISEVNITALRRDGTPIVGDDVLSVAIAPVNIAAFSTLDDPDTDDNEIEILLGGGPISTNGQGLGVAFVHSFDSPGVATLSVSFVDPDTGDTVSDSFDIEVVEQGATGVPNEIFFNVDAQPIYVQGTGGNDAAQFEIVLEDGAGEPVADPIDWNNLQISVLREGPNTGETVTANNFNGVPQQGMNIRSATVNGSSSVVLRTGTDPGIVTVQVTADRADNNVSNGLQDPVSDLRDFVVSDGRLFALEITVPDTDAILVNAVSPDAMVDPGTGIPVGPDGTYSLTVTALALDRFGQPVLPGTPIDFGVIGAPLVGFPTNGGGVFPLSGSDGNPNEGGVLFTSLSGQFQTAGGGAGPADTLVLLTEDTPDQDLEGARSIATVDTDTRLTVTSRFNTNNTTGSEVDNGPVIDYAIGRASDASIGEVGFTDEIGAASVTMNYPVSQLGRSVIVWAQGAGEVNQNNFVETVGDVELTRLPGVADAVFAAFPEMIPGNRTVDVLLCLNDALGSPIQGVTIGFNVPDPMGATVTVDGQTGAGTVAAATGPDGCSVASVTSSGVSPGLTGNVPLDFFVGGLSDTVLIVPPNGDTSTLFAIPSALNANQNDREILLILLDAGGNPIEGVQITGSCMGTSGMSLVTLVEPPGATDANGETVAVIDAQVDFFGEAGSGICNFAAAGGNPTATVTITGFDLCAFDPDFSPSCGDNGGGTQIVTVTILTSGDGSGVITDNLNEFSCNALGAGMMSGDCTANLNMSDLANIMLTATPDMGSNFDTWGAACTGSTNAMSGIGGSGDDRVCTATFSVP